MAPEATGERLRFDATVIAVAVGLGVLAFLVDYLDGVTGMVLTALVSSGLAWGLAAFLVGRRSTGGLGRVALDGASLLVAATVVYYLLVLLVSRRWSGAYVDDGRPADAYGLRSVAIMAGVWVVASLVAGPLFALLGHWVRVGAAGQDALAAGIACGLLASEGLYRLVWRTPAWRLDFSDPYRGEFFLGLALSHGVRVALPVAVLIWLTVAHRLYRSWPGLVAAAVAAASAGAAVWSALDLIATRI